jgi:threonine synthase
MQYVSTRGQVDPVSFQDAVVMGLAEDGGLLVPQAIPDVRDDLDHWAGLTYNELALEVISRFCDDLDRPTLRSLIDASYAESFQPDVAPVVQVGPLHVLELFHGPTLAFKDVALQLLGHLFEHILSLRDEHLNILAATSGDTGSAAIYGVRGRDRIEIFVMHPHGGVSPIQERQMTTVLDANVHNLAVKGSFDDCQRIMKSLASDLDFKRKYRIGAVNSVNWARVLAQIVYYFHGGLRLMRSTGAEGVRVTVPTGNFGDILAGWYAKQMGLPISRLILATNENDILTRFFNTGTYSLGEVFKSLSPAMDIQVASNFERYLYYKLGENPHRLRERMESFSRTGSLELPMQEGRVDPDFAAGRAGSKETLETIRTFQSQHGYLLDPHTAVGVCVGLRQGQGDPILALATAHPAKFPEAIRQATGADLAHHPDIDALSDLPTRCDVVEARTRGVRDYVTQVLDSRREES